MMGKASIVNADNGESGRGAVFDFSGSGATSGLAPGARTARRELKFHLDDLQPLKPPTLDAGSDTFVHFDAKLLAGAVQ
jgi:hypothetical protein